jgi:hypothetical protein
MGKKTKDTGDQQKIERPENQSEPATAFAAHMDALTVRVLQQSLATIRMMDPLDFDRIRGGSLTLLEMAHLVKSVGDVTEALGQLKAIYERFDAFLVRSALPAIMADAGMSSTNVADPDGTSYRFVLNDDISVSVKKDTVIQMPVMNDDGRELTEEEAAELGIDPTVGVTYSDWLARIGKESLIQETVNASSLKAALKKIIKDGKITIPAQLFEIKPSNYVAVTIKRVSAK